MEEVNIKANVEVGGWGAFAVVFVAGFVAGALVF